MERSNFIKFADMDTKYILITLSMMGSGMLTCIMVNVSLKMDKMEKLLELYINMIK